MRYYGLDFVDFYRGSLSFRKLLTLVRHLPVESAVATAQGGPGYSMLELLVMESGISGELNPRHPFATAEAEKVAGRKQRISDRAAYYEAQRQRQSAAQKGRDAGDKQSADADGQEPRRTTDEDQEQRD